MRVPRCLIARFRAYHYYDDLARACTESGMEVALAFCEYREDVDAFNQVIERFRPDFILSHPHFSESISAIGAARGIPVVHWMVDKIIHRGQFHRGKFSDGDLILSTYRHDVDHFRGMGVRAEYLPNACNILPVDDVHGDPRYGVGFVGTIELGENNYYRQFVDTMRTQSVGQAPELIAVIEKMIQFFDQVLDLQEEASKNFQYILPHLEKNLFRSLEGIFTFKNDEGDSANFTANDMVAILIKETSFRQRRHFFSALPSLDAFGPEDWTRANLPNVRYHGTCEQYRESGQVFAHSRINLAIARIYSLDGLSDRIFNVLFAGGFLLANRHDPLSELFREGIDLDTYATVEELLDKIRFYENNPQARERIARAGRENVLRNHTFKNRAAELRRLATSLRG
ncbi:MAG: glycosyltransferase [Magnetococcales bacterium]|nr:glycosyltransferase [Magnetococcales bacterium]